MTSLFRALFQIVLFVLPWPLRRAVLQKSFGFVISSTSRIGLSLILSRHLNMAEHARIGHGTVVRPIERLDLRASASIGNFNWIGGAGRSFNSDERRSSSLLLDEQAAITSRHIIDCTDHVRIGRMSIVAGYRSQILTHGIDVVAAEQRFAAVSIGDHCFVGSACVILKGATLPDCSVLAAGSVLVDAQSESFALYAGVPAQLRKRLPPEARFFTRTEGYIR